MHASSGDLDTGWEERKQGIWVTTKTKHAAPRLTCFTGIGNRKHSNSNTASRWNAGAYIAGAW